MICTSVIARDTEEALARIRAAAALGDAVELRLDAMQTFRLHDMILASSRPVMVTYRSPVEGGRGSADEETRMEWLLQGIQASAGFVDVEYRTSPRFRKKILREKGRTKVVLSAHFPEGTPNLGQMERLLGKMAGEEADVVKIVTRAAVPEDNLRVLSLIPMAHQCGVEIIAFCMGPVGRISRIATVLLGGYMTFASLEEGQETADGQIPARRIREILKLLEK